MPSLTYILGALRNGLDIEVDLPLPGLERTPTVRELAMPLQPAGLVDVADRKTVTASSLALRWLEEDSPLLLIAILHAHVRFVGEALAAIGAGANGHEKLREVANESFGMNWKSHDQLRRRTNWLREAGMADLWGNGHLVLTEAGKAASSVLKIVEPGAVFRTRDSGPVREPSLGSRALMASLDEDALSGRAINIGFVPSGGQDDPVRSLEHLTSACVPKISQDAFVALCRSEYEINTASSRASLDTLKRIGLIEHASRYEFVVSAAGQDWLESGNPIDLALILHSRIQFFMEVVDALDDAPTVADLASLTAEWTGQETGIKVPEIRTRLRILASCGLVERINNTRYRPTPLGLRLAADVPTALRIEPKAEVAASIETAIPPIAAFARVTAEIRAAGTDSQHPERLQAAVADLLELMGLDVKRLGSPGSKETDVLVSIPLNPTRSRRVCIDAKSAGDGRVSERAVNFDDLREHQQLHDADDIVLVGPGFSPTMIKRAETHGVRLIDIELLIKYMYTQADTPLSLPELATVFECGAEEQAQSAWQELDRTRHLTVQIHRFLWRQATDPRRASRWGGTLDVPGLALLLGEHDIHADPEDIEAALSILISPLIHAAELREDGRYTALLNPQLMQRRFAMLGGPVFRDS